MPTQRALAKAIEEGFDLVEIAPTAQPPVCKILNFGKYRYEEQQKTKDAKKKQKAVIWKEIRMAPKIDEHDIETKFKAAIRFLDEGDKLKVTVRFRGRENAHPERGRTLLLSIAERLKEHGVIERLPLLEGKQMIMIMNPVRQQAAPAGRPVAATVAPDGAPAAARPAAASTGPVPSAAPRPTAPVPSAVPRAATPAPSAAPRPATPVPSAAPRTTTPMPSAAPRLATPVAVAAPRPTTPVPSAIAAARANPATPAPRAATRIAAPVATPTGAPVATRPPAARTQRPA